MKKVVNSYSATVANLLVAQGVQFHTENAELMGPFIPSSPGLATVYADYKNATIALEAEYNQRTKAEETDLMAGKDWNRDGTTQFYLSSVDFFSKYPLNEEAAAAIYPIKFVRDAYSKTVKKDYKSETSAIRNLVSDTRNLTAQLAYFPSLAPLLDRLEAENNAFEELDLARTLALEDKRKRGTLGELMKKTNASFDSLVQVITGFYLAQQLTAPEKEALLKIIDILNAQIHRYTVIYHRHAGVNASKGNHQTPDITNPEVPGEGDGGDGGDGGDDGYQIPDIENPPFGE